MYITLLEFHLLFIYIPGNQGWGIKIPDLLFEGGDRWVGMCIYYIHQRSSLSVLRYLFVFYFILFFLIKNAFAIHVMQ